MCVCVWSACKVYVYMYVLYDVCLLYVQFVCVVCVYVSVYMSMHVCMHLCKCVNVCVMCIYVYSVCGGVNVWV